MKRNGSAEWTGDLKSGRGRLASGSGVLKDVAYSFATTLVVTGVQLVCRARVPELTDAMFQTIAARAKAECLVSRLLRTNITLEATLEA